jgi:hypothetical protein
LRQRDKPPQRPEACNLRLDDTREPRDESIAFLDTSYCHAQYPLFNLDFK